MVLVHRTAVGLLIALGVVHVAMTPVFFDEFAMRVMWYVAQGLLAIVIGFVNIAASRVSWDDAVVVSLCHAANALGVLFICLYAIVDPSPPSSAAIGIFVLLSISALLVGRKASRT